jgi:hypothetical protein
MPHIPTHAIYVGSSSCSDVGKPHVINVICNLIYTHQLFRACDNALWNVRGQWTETQLHGSTYSYLKIRYACISNPNSFLDF